MKEFEDDIFGRSFQKLSTSFPPNIEPQIIHLMAIKALDPNHAHYSLGLSIHMSFARIRV